MRACICLFNDYSLLRTLKRGNRNSANDPTTLTNNSNVKILVSILLGSKRTTLEKQIYMFLALPNAKI